MNVIAEEVGVTDAVGYVLQFLWSGLDAVIVKVDLE